MEFIDSLAIVGNAPSEVGTSNGKLIDSFDKVIRFNNYINDDDYGYKTDYWCRWSGVETKHREGPFEKVLISNPITHPIWQGMVDKPDWDNLNKHKDIMEIIPALLYFELREMLQLHCPSYSTAKGPSTGMCLLYWIWKERGYLYKDSIFGFNFFDRSKAHHHFDEEKFTDCHNGNAEKILFKYLIENESKL